ncbi:MAG: uridine kinase [Candidatus Sumerlaeales bacterium]|nr:uridine kinase [Candidatus Sumerlaeales bacterium]
MKSIIVGIAGGSGSGKTAVANLVMEHLEQRASLLGLDNYYIDFKHLPLEERNAINFDHPNAFDIPLILNELDKLRHNKPASEPIYDYTIHGRKPEFKTIEPAPVIIVEGILALAIPELREVLDVKLFVDTDADIRFIRRLKRDIAERGRTPESIIHQYLSTVRPMHMEFVEPSKRYADIIIPEGGYNSIAIDFIATKLKTFLS